MESNPENIKPADTSVSANSPDTTGETKPTTTAAPPTAENKTCFVSGDGQVVIKQLVTQLRRHPPSSYPCIVLQAFPKDHTRIRNIPGGGCELMFAHDELDAFIEAINAVAVMQGKGEVYKVLQRIPAKTPQRKQAWQRRNEARLGLCPKTQ